MAKSRRSRRPPENWPLPNPCYAICAIPRSGTTWFCELLSKTGVAGKPAEIFNAHKIDWAALKASPTAALGEAIRRGTTANGCFGYKLFPRQVHNVRRKLGVSPLDWLAPTHIIHIHRESLLDQAISHVRAIQRGAWKKAARPAREARYDFSAIAREIENLAQDEAYWRVCFAISALRPLSFSYEALSEAPRTWLAASLEHLGLDPAAAARLAEEDLTDRGIQRDQESSAWREQFLAEARGLAEQLEAGELKLSRTPRNLIRLIKGEISRTPIERAARKAGR